jgi:hypothetical protein
MKQPTISLERARFLAQCFGDVPAMRELGVPESIVQSHIPQKERKAPVTPPTDIHFGPTPTPTVETPRGEETPHFVEPGQRPRLGQCVHAFDPASGKEWPALVAEVFDGFRDEVPADSPDKVCRLVNPQHGPDRLSAKTMYYHLAQPSQDSASPIVRSKASWHRAAACEKGL